MSGYGRYLTLGVFAAAMGVLEAIVVVYLRQLYYPAGFSFPTVLIPPEMLSVELVREAVTLVMLACVGALAGRTRLERLGCFLFAFGVWDLLYYAGLKYFLGWPPSLLTWDVLFLIPVTWLAPVLAPVICALTMVLFSLCVAAPAGQGREARITPVQWGLLVSGAFLVFCTFVQDYAGLIIRNGFLPDFFRLANDERFLRLASAYVPARYNWPLFTLGELLVLAAIFLSAKGLWRGRAG
ncbi:MAG: hypothetical protein A2X32_08465 [Elusimicrobia bacterium GWC2_64_44]|nr:MAG: hypothetical protein A2X32_08465 [Elusimicrobia bacterium GWC2_64_44]